MLVGVDASPDPMLSCSGPPPADRARLALLQPVDQAPGHAGDFFEVGLELPVTGWTEDLLPTGEFQQRGGLLDAATSDTEEVLPLGFGETVVAFGDIGAEGQGGTACLR